MDKEIKIRPLKEQDLDKVIILDRLTLQGLWTLVQYQRELNYPNSRFWLLCLTDSETATEQIIGMGCWRAIACDAEIPIFAIHPEYQNQGLGKFFFSWLLQDMINYNSRYARLEVRVSNQRAIAMYRKFGFQVINRLSNYYQNNQEDAHKMISPSLRSQPFRQQLDFWLSQFYP